MQGARPYLDHAGVVLGEQVSGAEMSTTRVTGMTRRLFRLMAAAARLAWRASPRDTVTTVALNLAAGV